MHTKTGHENEKSDPFCMGSMRYSRAIWSGAVAKSCLSRLAVGVGVADRSTQSLNVRVTEVCAVRVIRSRASDMAFCHWDGERAVACVGSRSASTR